MPAPTFRSAAMQARLFVLAWVLLAAACSKKEPAAEAPPIETPIVEPVAEPSPATGTETMPFQKTDLAPGNGAEIKSGQSALVHYTGWLYDAAAPDNKGAKFDSS